MLRVVVFDFGGTLVDAALQPRPHAVAALQAISALRDADGRPLATCLVADGPLAPAPPTPRKVKPLFDVFLAQLDRTGLRPCFEPVQRRITLTTHAGAALPSSAVFEAALHRLRSQATLAECLFVSANAVWVDAARGTLGMQALRYGGDFDDWSQAPALVAHAAAPDDATNVETAARAVLAARGVEASSLVPAGAGCWRLQGQAWHPLQVPRHPELGTLHVALPVAGELRREPGGALHAALAIDEGAADEAAAYAASLADHGQIGSTGAPARGATHAVETDAAGRRCLVRKRFSAL